MRFKEFLGTFALGTLTGVVGTIGVQQNIDGYRTLFPTGERREPTPHTRIYKEDRNGDNMPDYIVEELVNGKWELRKMIAGSLNEDGEVVWDPTRNQHNPFP